MFSKIIITIAIASAGILLVAILCTVDAEHDTYLDRLLKLYEEKLSKEGQRRNPIQIKATITKRPPGFESPKTWTKDSVMRLLHLIKENDDEGKVMPALRNMLSSFVEAEGSDVKVRGIDDDLTAMESVIQIENHLQAGLPSAQIRGDTLMEVLVPKLIATLLKLAKEKGSMVMDPSFLEAIFSMGSMGDHGEEFERGGRGDGGSGRPGSPGRPGNPGRPGSPGRPGFTHNYPKQSGSAPGGRPGYPGGSTGHKPGAFHWEFFYNGSHMYTTESGVPPKHHARPGSPGRPGGLLSLSVDNSR